MTDPVRLIENAALVLPDRVERGWVAVENGRIAEVGEGRAPERGLDLDGDYLLPGLVELHTDHLEGHYAPRPKVRWHPLGAVLAYDAQIAASGITTVFDSLRAGVDVDGGGLGAELVELAEAVDEARRHGLFRCEHHTHLRCEIPSPDVVDTVENFVARFPVGLISLMDHTPGQRQFRDLSKYLHYYGGKTGKTVAEIEDAVALKQEVNGARSAVNRPALVALARERKIPLASHDDTTLAEVDQSIAEGVVLAEFPTTVESAWASHAHGITVMMGAPNLIRGGSHSGNVAAEELARQGVLDILSSDYVPGSLVMAAFDLPRRVPSISLPEAVRLVTRNPAEATGLSDRGEIAAGKRADLVRVRVTGEMPVVREVWRQGSGSRERRLRPGGRPERGGQGHPHQLRPRGAGRRSGLSLPQAPGDAAGLRPRGPRHPGGARLRGRGRRGKLRAALARPRARLRPAGGGARRRPGGPRRGLQRVAPRGGRGAPPPPERGRGRGHGACRAAGRPSRDAGTRR
jgi:alpha-D-ribose 1-methylphosphonate 5-triphosphate diphosphatase